METARTLSGERAAAMQPDAGAIAPEDQTSLYSPSTVSSSVSGRPEPPSPAPPS